MLFENCLAITIGPLVSRFTRSLCLMTALTACLSLSLAPAQARSRHPVHRAHHTAAYANHLRRLAAHKAHVAAHKAHVAAHKAHLARQNKALHSGNVVSAAFALRGTRYVMGGTSRSGFDCSGFVRYILSNTGGVDLPRTATEQYYHGTPITKDNLQPGDLVFFKNTYKPGISHVGIYVGNNHFIHAANAHKGVREDSLGSAYYARHYAGARRVLPAQMREASLAR